MICIFHETINGIGERAGNAAIEEIERKCTTDIKINQVYNNSKLVYRLTGAYLQPNKAIVGENAFAHESGIHTDGVAKNTATYEPITPACRT